MRRSTSYNFSHPLALLLAVVVCRLTGSPRTVGVVQAQTTTPVPSPATAMTEPTFEPTGSSYPTSSAIPTFNVSFVPTASVVPTSETVEPSASLFPTQPFVDDFTPTIVTTGPTTTPASSSSCAVCNDNEATMATPDKSIPSLTGDSVTCGQLDATLRNVATGTAGEAVCQTALTSVNPVLPFLDLSAFCGCSGSEPPQYCSFCQEGQILPDDQQDTAVDVPDFGTVSCAQGQAFTDYVTNGTACKEWNIALVAVCCADGTIAPTPIPAPSPPSPPTTTTPPTRPTSAAFARGLVRSSGGWGATTLLLASIGAALLLGDL